MGINIKVYRIHPLDFYSNGLVLFFMGRIRIELTLEIGACCQSHFACPLNGFSFAEPVLFLFQAIHDQFSIGRIRRIRIQAGTDGEALPGLNKDADAISS